MALPAEGILWIVGALEDDLENSVGEARLSRPFRTSPLDSHTPGLAAQARAQGPRRDHRGHVIIADVASEPVRPEG